MSTKSEIIENRKAVKEKGIINWIKEQLKYEWFPSKENPYRPLQAIYTFSKGVLLFYFVFVIFQAVNFSFIFCNSNVIETNDYISARMDWNDYLIERDETCQFYLNQFGQISTNYIDNEDFQCQREPVLSCEYNFEIVGEQPIKEYLNILKNNIKYKVPFWN